MGKSRRPPSARNGPLNEKQRHSTLTRPWGSGRDDSTVLKVRDVHVAEAALARHCPILRMTVRIAHLVVGDATSAFPTPPSVRGDHRHAAAVPTGPSASLRGWMDFVHCRLSSWEGVRASGWSHALALDAIFNALASSDAPRSHPSCFAPRLRASGPRGRTAFLSLHIRGRTPPGIAGMSCQSQPGCVWRRVPGASCPPWTRPWAFRTAYP